MIGARNVRGGLILISLGFLSGLVMSLYAFEPMVPVPGSLQSYDDLPRRLLRLGHIAAVMLPLLNVVFGGWLDCLNLPSRAKQWASWLLLVGAAAVPAALFVEAVWAPARDLRVSAVPVIAFCAGVFLVSFGACRKDLRHLTAGNEVDQDRPRRGGIPARARVVSDRRGGGLDELGRCFRFP